MPTVETYDTLADAAAALRDDAAYLGGGTLVMRGVNYGAGWERILRARDPALREIRAEGDRIRIGAGATFAQVMAASDLDFLAPVARSIGGPAVRNMGTVGGNLFARSPFGDFAAALLALDATVRTTSGETPLETFLAQREAQRGLVEAVSIPRPARGDFRFLKVSRTKPKGASVMSIAAWLPRQGGRLAGVRIAFNAMGATPLRAKAAERALEGGTLDKATVERAAAAALEGLDPQDDAIASAWYRREVAPVHLRRLLLDEGRGR